MPRQATAARVPGVKAAVPYVEARGLFANGQRVAGAMVRGVLPEEEVKAVGLAQRLKSGALADLAAGQVTASSSAPRSPRNSA